MKDHLKIMLDLVRDAGRMALQLMANSHPELKADTSVITAADRAISRMAHDRLKPLINTGAHVLIDEEDPRRAEYLDEAFLRRTPCVWSIDPIDGTRVYANGMPHYGISIGLIKDRIPYMGAVHFPSLNELFYCDGDQAYVVTAPFTWKARRKVLQPVDEELSSRSVFIISDELGKSFAWKSADCRYMVLSSAVTEYCWPAAGRSCGSISRVNLWDLAGSWPIVHKAGLQFRNVKTGAVLDRLDAALFHQDPAWKLKDFYILSSPRNFDLLRQRLVFL